MEIGLVYMRARYYVPYINLTVQAVRLTARAEAYRYTRRRHTRGSVPMGCRVVILLDKERSNAGKEPRLEVTQCHRVQPNRVG
jgi:hypothetical protein